MLAIDPGTQSLGLSVFANGNLVDYEGLKTKEKDNNKTATMAKLLLTALEQANPIQVVIEDVYEGKSITSIKGNTILQGVVLAYCIQHDIPLWVFKTAEWRKLLGIKNGKREQAKIDDMQYVLTHTDIEKDSINEDIADAICIGLAYCKLFQEV